MKEKFLMITQLKIQVLQILKLESNQEKYSNIEII